MPLAIQFNAKPAPFGGDDLVGRFRSGQQQQGLPRALQEWRITSDDKEILTKVGALLGGKPAKWDTKSAEVWEVLTKAPSVDIDLEFINVNMVLWGRGNAPIRTCDMLTQKGGSPCECPSDYSERKQAGRDGVGCAPETRAIFRLTEAPDLGKFKFQSGSWGLSEKVTELEAQLADAGGTAPATLTLKQIQYTTKTGKDVEYTLPVIKILEPV